MVLENIQFALQKNHSLLKVPKKYGEYIVALAYLAFNMMRREVMHSRDDY